MKYYYTINVLIFLNMITWPLMPENAWIKFIFSFSIGAISSGIGNKLAQ